MSKTCFSLHRKLLSLLPAVKGYRIDDTRALVLMTADGETIVARR